MRTLISSLIPIVLLVVGFGCGEETTLTRHGSDEMNRPTRIGSPVDPGQAEDYQASAQGAVESDRELGYSVIVELPMATVPAGTPVDYTVRVLLGIWDVTASFETELEIRPAAGVTVNPTNLIFSTPGQYELIVTATGQETVVKGSTLVTVVVGAPVSLTVEAVPDTAMAGEEVSFVLSALDVVGNPITATDLADASLTLQPGDRVLPVGERSVTLTEPGRYEIHASLGTSLSDIDVFYVTPGDPATLDLVLAEHGILDPGAALDYTVSVADAYGNPIEVHGALVFTEPSTGTLVEARRIRFEEEGSYQVIAGIPGSTLEDSDGPVVVDGYGPVITITAPERGSVQRSSQVTVRGSVVDNVTGVSSVELNGQAVTLGRGGSFSVTLSSAVGVNLLEMAAVDGAGHESSMVQSYLYGSAFVPSGNTASGTLLGRINQGTLNMLEDYVEGEFSPSYLRSLIMANRTIYSTTVNWGLDSFWLRVTVEDFSISSVRMELIPRSGYVELQVYLYNLYTHIHERNGAWYVPDLDANFTANYALLTARLALGVTNGNITATLSNVAVAFNNPQLDLGVPQIFRDIGLDIEGWIWDYMEDDVKQAIIDAVYDQAPPAIDSYLSDLEIPRMPIDLYGKRLWFQVIPGSFSMQSTGITMYLNSIVQANTVHPDYADGPGALFTSSSYPSYGSTPGFVLSVADDFLNQALNAIWESNLINNIFQTEAGGSLDLSFLEFFVPDATSFEIEIDPLLPPVFIPGQVGAAQGEVQAGDMLIDIYACYSNETRSLMAQVAVTVFANVRLGMTSSNMVDFEVVGAPEFYFDGLVSTIPNLDDEGIETLLEVLVPALVPSLIEGVQRFPLPSFEGLTINNPTVSLSGGFISLSGNLTLQ